MYLVVFHHLLSSHLLCLVQGSKLDVLRREGFVSEWALDGVQVVGSNGDECALSRKVLMEFVLESDEGLIARLGEVDVPQNGT